MESNNEIKEKSTRDKIFDAAVELFSQRGFSAVSVREITREVGIKESSLYNHFKSKDDILRVIFDYFEAEIGKGRASDEEVDRMLEVLSPEAFFQQHILSVGKNINAAMDKIFRIVFMEQFRNERARSFVMEEIIRKPGEYAEKAFRKMMDRGMIRPCDPALLADEYNYALVALSLEYNITKQMGLDIGPVAKKMFEHASFICDKVKLQG